MNMDILVFDKVPGEFQVAGGPISCFPYFSRLASRHLPSGEVGIFAQPKVYFWFKYSTGSHWAGDVDFVITPLR
jgi:hypothetical protein